jgi:hypothetical protein
MGQRHPANLQAEFHAKLQANLLHEKVCAKLTKLTVLTKLGELKEGS